jgi:hypothetical protein
MPRFEHTVEIRRPVGDVFAFHTDPCNLARLKRLLDLQEDGAT